MGGEGKACRDMNPRIQNDCVGQIHVVSSFSVTGDCDSLVRRKNIRIEQGAVSSGGL